MESASQKVIEIIKEIRYLFSLSDGPSARVYSVFISGILEKLHKPHDLSQIARNILSTYGGMATFGDVVLYKNGNVMVQETRAFDELREELFLACKSIVENNGRIVEKQPSALSRLFAKFKNIGN